MTAAAGLEAALRRHAAIADLLDRFAAIGLPDSWLVAGAVAQSVWNAAAGRAPGHGIKDVDIVYFDGDDLSAEAEAAREMGLRGMFSDCPFGLDVKNEARVHLWYAERFGTPLTPYVSSAGAIATFP